MKRSRIRRDRMPADSAAIAFAAAWSSRKPRSRSSCLSAPACDSQSSRGRARRLWVSIRITSLTADVSLHGARYDSITAINSFFVRAIDGIRRIAVDRIGRRRWSTAASGNRHNSLAIEGAGMPVGQLPEVGYASVAGDYFKTLEHSAASRTSLYRRRRTEAAAGGRDQQHDGETVLRLMSIPWVAGFGSVRIRRSVVDDRRRRRRRASKSDSSAIFSRPRLSPINRTAGIAHVGRALGERRDDALPALRDAIARSIRRRSSTMSSRWTSSSARVCRGARSRWRC